jgi:signal transduction histidine kinase
MELQGVNLNQLIEKTLTLNSNLLKINSVKVQKKLSKGLPDLVGSEDQLQQVFMNLFSNAVESMAADGGGVLGIETKYSTKNDQITVLVKDTGVGISQENIPRLFEPFFTTKKKGKGVGLGLSVAYGIIKEHGGSFYVSSQKGEGTFFKINLPLKHSSSIPVKQGDPNGQH